jgi:hypothetical protein
MATNLKLLRKDTEKWIKKIDNELKGVGSANYCSNCGGGFRIKVVGQTRCSECQTTKELRKKIRRISGL